MWAYMWHGTHWKLEGNLRCRSLSSTLLETRVFFCCSSAYTSLAGPCTGHSSASIAHLPVGYRDHRCSSSPVSFYVSSRNPNPSSSSCMENIFNPLSFLQTHIKTFIFYPYHYESTSMLKCLAFCYYLHIQ